MIATANRIVDLMATAEGGANSGVAPSLLGANQVAFSINNTFRGGYANCRPGWTKVGLKFPDTDTQTAFQTGKFQGASCHNYQDGSAVLLAVIGGLIFSIGIRSSDVTNVSGSVSIPTSREMVYMEQGEDWTVINDLQSRPIIYNGASARYSDPTRSQLTSGGPIAYAHGRFWYATTEEGGTHYEAGDLVGGSSGSVQYAFSDSILYQTENTFLNEGGSFGLPSKSGRIVGFAIPGSLDDALGQGPLIVFGESGVFVNLAPIDRTVWKSLEVPIQKPALPNLGAVSSRAIVPVNTDVWFRSTDGIRPLRLAIRNFSDEWAQTPASREIGEILAKDSPHLLKFGSGCLFDNRMLFTCSPDKASNGSVYHRGLVVMDLDPLSNNRDKLPPCWDGLWTGLLITQILSCKSEGVERCFAFTVDDSGQNSVWELSKNALFDRADGITDKRIERMLITRSFGLGKRTDLKRLSAARMQLDEIVGTLDGTVEFRPDATPEWTTWHTFNLCVPYQQCTVDSSGCVPIRNYRKQFRRLRLPQPPDTCQTAPLVPARLGCEFQLKLSLTGQARLRSIELGAQPVFEQEIGCDSATSEECVGLEYCDDDWFTYKAYA